jgi:hypothetical protein
VGELLTTASERACIYCGEPSGIYDEHDACFQASVVELEASAASEYHDAKLIEANALLFSQRDKMSMQSGRHAQ